MEKKNKTAAILMQGSVHLPDHAGSGCRPLTGVIVLAAALQRLLLADCQRAGRLFAFRGGRCC